MRVVNTKEINRLLKRIDKAWLAKRIAENRLLNVILEKPINISLLRYVDAKIKGVKPAPLRRKARRNLNGKVTIKRVSLEEMERLWK